MSRTPRPVTRRSSPAPAAPAGRVPPRPRVLHLGCGEALSSRLQVLRGPKGRRP